MTESLVLPGDQVSSIEEYESGNNTFTDDRSVRATAVGIVNTDGTEHKVSVKNLKTLQVPEPNDIIMGTVVAQMASRIAISIHTINGKTVTTNLECICPTRNRKERIVALVGDVVKLKIVSRLNGDNHASISEPDTGVIFTRCRKCASRVIKISDGVKCAECGWRDDRKMSSEYGNEELLTTLTQK